MSNLQARRERVEKRIAELKAECGQAFADGKPFAGQGELDALLAEIRGIVQGEGVQADRDRAEREEIRLRMKSDLQSELAGHWRDMLEDWALLELSMKNVADLIQRMRRRVARTNTLIPAIAGRGIPGALTAQQLDAELAMWVMSGLQSSVNPNYRLGMMAFPMQVRGGLYPVERDWSEIQQKRGQASIDAIVEGAQPMPKEQLLAITHQPETAIHEHGDSEKAA